MKRQDGGMKQGQMLGLLAGILLAMSQAAPAQVFHEEGGVSAAGGGYGGGGSGEFSLRTDGAEPPPGAGHLVMVVGGPDGQIDIGAELLKACDANQDGGATADELKVRWLAWFQQADTATNNALSGTDLAAALQQIFPVPPPPPGAPEMPAEMALHNLLAKKILEKGDADKDGWLTRQEGTTFVDQSFAAWDADGSGTLNASEFVRAFSAFMPPPRGGGTFHRRAR